MIYTLDNIVRIGRRVDRIVDANGLEWTKCIECDTETGRILRFKTDERGMVMANHDEAMQEEIKAASPLIVTFRDPEPRAKP